MERNTLFPIPPEDLLKLREMTRMDGERFLRSFPLHEEEITKLLEFTTGEAPPTVRVQVMDPLRRRFMAAAWIAGASQAQLGTLFGSITRQSVMQQLDKTLPGHQREKVKRLLSKLPYERLGRMREIYYSTPTYHFYTPQQAAEVLVAATVDWEDE